ncbi:F390 synthetase-related protein [Cytophaga aurantiaca]|uniref:F390 synthetase-related protein n=1 Tax=Cytophaga aurantiaca TaxID=29530 RepID=UPI00035EDF07|nr:F390 synthetase-related protein [Cytophaga aurantiaca]
MFKIKIIFYWITFKLRRKFTDKESLMSFQEKSFKRFALQTLTKSPYYRPYNSNTLQDLAHISVIEKSQFMEHFNTINTLGIDKEQALQIALEAEQSRNFTPQINNVTIGLSTGTSGKRGIFLVSEDERAQWVAMVMSRVIEPKLFKKQKIAFFLRASSNLYSSVQSSLFIFEYFDIFEPIEQLAAKLQQYQPDILAAPPSMLADLAKRQEDAVINIHPHQIISFAEVLYDSDKIYIEKIFRQQIKQIYQCTEGFLGVSCRYGNIHLNEDIVYIEKEYITHNRFYPIITDFTRTTQPVVRYKLNDVLIEKQEPCACGSAFTTIEKIEGRSDDILLFHVTNQFIKLYPDLICRKIAQYTDNFRAYKIVQPAWDQLHIYIESAAYEEAKVLFTQAIESLFEMYSIRNISFSYFNTIPVIKGNKIRKIERTFDEHNI